MNIRLRKRHRWMTTGMALVTPALIVAAIAVRQQVPLDEGTANYPTDMGQHNPIPFSPDWPVEVIWLNKANNRQLFLNPAKDLLGPSLHLYWDTSGSLPVGLAEVNSPVLADLPETYLGPYLQTEATLIDLPANFLQGEGQLILYSVIKSRIVAVSQVMEVSL